MALERMNTELARSRDGNEIDQPLRRPPLQNHRSLVILLSSVRRCGHYAIGPRNIRTGNLTLARGVGVRYPRRVLNSPFC